MSYFSFVKNTVLEENLNVAFNHILTLIPLSESKAIGHLEKSSFHKTIIIYTASIIEALLFYIVCEKCSKNDLDINTWEIKNIKDIFVIDQSRKIIGGEYELKKSTTQLDKMNLGDINNFLFGKKLINKGLFSDIDKVRILRNDQHFGPHQIVKEYSKADMEFVFSVAKDVKSLVKGV